MKRNAQKAKVYDRCRVLNMDWQNFVKVSAGREQFDIIFIDPPYASEWMETVLQSLIEADCVAEHGIVICESGDDRIYTGDGLTVSRHNRYGQTYVTLLRRENEEDGV